MIVKLTTDRDCKRRATQFFNLRRLNLRRVPCLHAPMRQMVRASTAPYLARRETLIHRDCRCGRAAANSVAMPYRIDDAIQSIQTGGW